MKSAFDDDQPVEIDDEGGVSVARRPLSQQRFRPGHATVRGAANPNSFMDSTEHVEEQLRPRRASERRSSLQQIEALKVRRASERRSSVELSAELVDAARTRRAS